MPQNPQLFIFQCSRYTIFIFQKSLDFYIVSSKVILYIYCIYTKAATQAKCLRRSLWNQTLYRATRTNAPPQNADETHRSPHMQSRRAAPREF